MWNQLKTALLLGVLSGLVLAAGYLFGGNAGLTVALAFAVLMNFSMYFWSHKLVLWMYRAQPMRKHDYPRIHKLVEDVAHAAGLPKPTLYLVPTMTPNAFATGPSPRKAVVAFTQGILELLDEHELKGVVAHELSHVKNRDMLVTTIAATLAAVISYVAHMARYAAMVGGMERDRNNSGTSLVALLAFVIFAPIAALLLQLAVSRSREYLADESGAHTIKDSKGLAQALRKLEHGCRARPLRTGSPATSSLFIVNPFSGSALFTLFSTHPPTEKRIQRLQEMKW